MRFRTSETVVVLAVLAGAALAAEPAYVRVSPRDARYFELTDGRPYIPIGLNMVRHPAWPRGEARHGARSVAGHHSAS